MSQSICRKVLQRKHFPTQSDVSTYCFKKCLQAMHSSAPGPEHPPAHSSWHAVHSLLPSNEVVPPSTASPTVPPALSASLVAAQKRAGHSATQLPPALCLPPHLVHCSADGPEQMAAAESMSWLHTVLHGWHVDLPPFPGTST